MPYEQLKYARQVESRSLHLQQGLQDPGA